MAEGEGFEPPDLIQIGSLVNFCFKPLSHPSVKLVPKVGVEPTKLGF
jgi:hypothetical protein